MLGLSRRVCSMHFFHRDGITKHLQRAYSCSFMLGTMEPPSLLSRAASGTLSPSGEDVLLWTEDAFSKNKTH